MKNDALVNAIFYLIQTCRSLEDDIEETASFLAEEARIDYDEFEESGESYDKDAKHVHEVVSRLHSVATAIDRHLQDINNSLDGIEASTEESAHGITDVTGNTEELVREKGEITREVNKL